MREDTNIRKQSGCNGEFCLEDDTNFENQMTCDYLINLSDKGCGRQKRQIASFRLKKKPGKIPVRDFFNFLAGPHLPDFRIYGISAKARELILKNNITGCEIQPILSYEGEALSNIYQLTITGETRGALPMKERLSDLKKTCSVCGHTAPIKAKLHSENWQSVIPDNFFSEKDFQICDRMLAEGKELRGFSLFPLLIISEKIVKVYKENGLKGLSITPVNLLSEVQAAGLLDETIFPVMKIE